MTQGRKIKEEELYQEYRISEKNGGEGERKRTEEREKEGARKITRAEGVKEKEEKEEG